jgi:hypothetical protein
MRGAFPPRLVITTWFLIKATDSFTLLVLFAYG